MEDVTIHLTGARRHRVAGVSLIPGNNAASVAQWDAIKSHPIGAKLIEDGTIFQRIDAPKRDKSKPEPKAETETPKTSTKQKKSK